MKKSLVLVALLLMSAPSQADRFSLHRDSYLTLFAGHADGVLRAQFSGKYKFVDILDPDPEGSGAYFAYSSRLMWDMWNAAESWPIYDVNHLPEFFLRQKIFNDSWLKRALHIEWVEAGYRHESNGGSNAPDPQDPGDLTTKSYFQGYLRLHHEFRGEQAKLSLDLEGRAFHVVWENPDIADYLGRIHLESRLQFRLFQRQDGSWAMPNNELAFRTNSSLFQELPSRHPTAPPERVLSMEAMLAIGAEPIIRAIHLDGSGQFFVLYHHGWGEFLSTYNDRRDHRVYFGLRLAPQATWDD